MSAEFLRVPLKNGGVRVRLDRLTDGRVMCCLCFDYCTRDELNPLDDGRVEDICKSCAENEKQYKAPA